MAWRGHVVRGAPFPHRSRVQRRRTTWNIVMRGEAVDRADTVVQAVRLLELVILNQSGSWSRHDS